LARKPKVQKLNDFCKKEVNIVSSFLALGAVKSITFLIKKLALLRYELNYKFHLRVRTFHDVMVVRSPSYKKVSESRYARPVKNATVSAFFVSLLLFTTIQYVMPYFNIFIPQKAQAGANSKTWTTRGDFNTGTTKSGNPEITGALDSDDASINLSSGYSWFGETGMGGPPTGRSGHTAVWTGETGNSNTSNRMIIWGSDQADVNGGIYNKATNSWTAVSTVGAPAARLRHRAIWTGNTGNSATANKMIVWGGYSYASASQLNTGGIYDIATNTWTSTSVGANVPSSRDRHSIVWTGSKMIVWGGGAFSPTNTGSVYDPGTNSWTAMTNTNVPVARFSPAAVWTGETGNPTSANKMIVWGGNGTNTGGIYDPIQNIWTATSVVNAPSARSGFTCTWTGTVLVVHGGNEGSLSISSGGMYNPVTNTWTATSLASAPVTQGATAVWTGSRVLIMGGYGTGSYLNATYVFNPSDNNWSQVNIGAPEARAYHTAIWTGTSMIVWGGDGVSLVPDGEGGYMEVGAKLNTGGILNQGVLSPAAISGFIVDTGTGNKAKWSTVSWVTAPLPANTTISFKARTSEDSITWSSWSADQIQDIDGSTTSSGNFGALQSSRYLDIIATLASTDGLATPTLNDFTIVYDSLEAPLNANLNLTRTDGRVFKQISNANMGAGLPGGVTSESQVNLTATGLTCGGGTSGNAACGLTGTNIRPEVEIKPVQAVFDGSGTFMADQGSTTVTLTGLVDQTSYHIRVRAIDDQGRASAWTSYGGNSDGNIPTTPADIDLTIDQIAPTVSSVTIDGGNQYAPASGVVSVNASFTDSYAPTAANNYYQYVVSEDGVSFGMYDNASGNNSTSTFTGGSMPSNVVACATTSCSGLKWKLSSGDGAKKVYVAVRDNAGNISGTWVQTTKSDFDSATNLTNIATNTNGSFALSVGNTSGSLEASLKDSVVGQKYGGLYWSSNVPSQTGAGAVRFQVASNNDNTTWNYVGPDGTATSYFTAAGTSVGHSHDGNRYIRYKAYLATTNAAYTPTIFDVNLVVLTTSSSTITLDSQSPTGTVSVRSADPLYAPSKNVTLNLEATDPGPSGLKDFSLSNDANTWSAWTAWDESYRAAGTGYAWALADGEDGERKVYVKYRDNAGNIGGITNPNNYFTGITGTQLENKYVYNIDIPGTVTWGPASSFCTSPQCSGGTLVSPQSFPEVDFFEYGAQNACKVVGGRLPTTLELSAIYAARSSYGNNFLNTYYVSAQEATRTTVGSVNFNGGSVVTFAKGNASRPRCVRDSGVPSFSVAITLDTATPTSTLSASPVTPNGDNSWYMGTRPSATISASDTGSNIAKISYRFDADSAPYTDVVNTNTDQPFVANIASSDIPEGTHTLYYFATDKSGQVEPHKSQVFNVDIQAPTTGYGIYPELPTGLNDWYVITAPNITLTGTDSNGGNNSGVANIYYQWTNVGGTPQAGSYLAYTAPIPSAQGDKALHYYTKDIAGNVGNVQTQHIKFNAYVPDVPTGFRAPKSEASLGSIVLHWDAVTNDPTGITTYNLQRRKRTPSLGAWTNIVTGTCSGLSGSSVDCVDNSGLEAGFQYGYKIQAVDNAGNAGNWSDEIYGYTTDTVSPPSPSAVTATPCDGTTGTCPAGNTKGFSIKVSWSPSVDLGVGLSRYIVYRKMAPTDYLSKDGWTVVGVVDGTSAPSNPVFYDNDTTNDYFDGSDKAIASDRLNDSSSYYYRITALDISETGNPSLLVDDNDMFYNLTSLPGTTPDVTAPTVPQDLVASAMGIDSNPASSLPEDPATVPQSPILHQRIRLTWSASSDLKARTAELTTNTITYHVFKLNPSNSTYEEIATTSSLSYNVDGLQDFTEYSFKVSAVDSSVAHNVSAQSSSATKKTASSAVPTVPTEVTVKSLKGDPAVNAAVGHENTVTFFGSYAKNCDPIPNVRCLVRYEVYRSTTNYLDDEDWLVIGNATKIAEITPRVKGNDRKINENDVPYSVTDTGLNDATTYYYKVRALDNTPLVPDGGPYYSPMTAVSVGTLYQGWDITPDATKPTIPVGGLEVKVRDTHPSATELRNIITWKMLADTELPTRAGFSDFARYEVHREVVNAAGQPISDTNVGNVPNLGDNYLIDIMLNIPELSALTYRYYVDIVDNAKTEFKYSNGTPINDYSNVSAPEYWADSIVPSKVKPVLTQPVTLSSIGVSSATVNWQTDQEADSLIQFRKKGTDDNYIALGQIERSFNHVVNLFGLKPTTEYEYQLVSRNYLGNNVDYVAANLPTLKTTGFTIAPGAVISTTSTTEISWTTNLDASSAFVEYQLQRQLGDDAQGGTAGVEPAALTASPTNHKVVVKGLRSARTYTYKIKSISKDGYLSEYPAGEFATFRTKAFDSAQFTLAPASSNVAERNITATTAQIVWQTESPTTSWVDYSTTSGVYDGAAGNNDLVGTHVVVIDGLIPGTKYYYRVRVKDANEVEYTSQEYSFTAVLKPKISNMTVKNITPYSVTIAWDTNVDTETIINWGKTAAYGEKRGKSGVSKVHEIVVDKLDDNQEYHYQILAKDDAGNEVADTDKLVRTPLDTEGPKITGVKIDVLPMGESDTTSSIIVSWQTNKPASTLVEYGEGVIGGTYDKSSVEDTTLNNSHTVIIKGLTPASSYHYRLVSADKRANKTISQDYTFVTPSKEKSILQLIIKSLEETFSWTRNLNQFFGNIGKRLTGR